MKIGLYFLYFLKIGKSPRSPNREPLSANSPVNHNVEHGDKTETDVTEVCRESLEVLFLSESVWREFLRELVVDLQVLLVPVVQQVMVGRHHSTELVHSVRTL